MPHEALDKAQEKDGKEANRIDAVTYQAFVRRGILFCKAHSTLHTHCAGTFMILLLSNIDADHSTGRPLEAHCLVFWTL